MLMELLPAPRAQGCGEGPGNERAASTSLRRRTERSATQSLDAFCQAASLDQLMMRMPRARRIPPASRACTNRSGPFSSSMPSTVSTCPARPAVRPGAYSVRRISTTSCTAGSRRRSRRFLGVQAVARTAETAFRAHWQPPTAAWDFRRLPTRCARASAPCAGTNGCSGPGTRLITPAHRPGSAPEEQWPVPHASRAHAGPDGPVAQRVERHLLPGDGLSRGGPRTEYLDRSQPSGTVTGSNAAASRRGLPPGDRSAGDPPGQHRSRGRDRSCIVAAAVSTTPPITSVCSKAAVIASGIVPPGMEGAEQPLPDLLARLSGRDSASRS